MFYEVKIKNWETVRKLILHMRTYVPIWAFRGQGDQKWPLSTKFERDAKKYSCHGYFHPDRERYVLREFKRRAHHYIQNLPDEGDNIEWLSLMQHHGGTTRLLDFTYSFYVAAFFAMENSTKDSSIWAINLNKLTKSLPYHGLDKESECYKIIIDEQKKIANECINDKKTEKDASLIIDPNQQHERISIQQGLFLFPCNREKLFEENLCSSFNFKFHQLKTVNAKKVDTTKISAKKFMDISILKIIIPKEIHATALYDLNEMNITSATLFPGLDGFARSLTLHLRKFEN